MKKKIAVIFGTRPELIKLFVVIQELKKKCIVQLIHTGQHYSKELHQNQLDVFQVQIDHQLDSYDPDPLIHLGKMIGEIQKILLKEQFTGVVIHGDTNSTLAGAICARKNNIPLFHIESGARCFDKNVPEEQNRIVADHFATLNFAYDKESKGNLKLEGLKKNIFAFSNTAYSTCHYIDGQFLKKHNTNEDYALITLHRAENTDDGSTLTKLISAINLLAQRNNLIFPMHPRTKKKINEFGLALDSSIKIIEPLDYFEFIKLLKCCKFIVSDSGGIVDESVYFNRPLIILRKKTERNDLVRQKKIRQVNPGWPQSKINSTLKKIIQNDLKKMKRIKVVFDVLAAKKIASKILDSK